MTCGGVIRVACSSWFYTASRSVHSDIKAHYDSLVAADRLKFDPHQLGVVKNLQALQKELKGYQPHRPGIFEKVESRLRILSLIAVVYYA